MDEKRGEMIGREISENTLYARGLSKTFGSSKALDHVDLEIPPGEIHGLLGQNGCGKSTLIKILSGFHAPDEGGKVWVNGQEIHFPLAPSEFVRFGMSFVHQDLGLIPDLTVLENLRIGEVACSKKNYIDWRVEGRKAEEMFERYHLNICCDVPVASLGPVEQAMLAIVRAAEEIEKNVAEGRKSGLLVLDEPTVFLPRAEVDTLFQLIRKISGEGISIMFVSHDLDEVMELTDSFTVLRDGKNCGSRKTKSVNKSEIVELILGKTLRTYQMKTKQEGYFQEKSIEVEQVSGDIINDANFCVYQGEVVGLTGLVGSGFEEIPYLLFGSAVNRRGRVRMNGHLLDLERLTPVKAVEAGMALIPADRQNFGAIRELHINENIMMRILNRFPPLHLNNRTLRENSECLIEKFDVQPPDAEMELGQLSGGNQQKVILAKWLQTDPRLVILHEPTQGIDVGARQQVYQYIGSAAKDGAAVLCSSSDYEQLEQICDRVLIFVKGRIVKELTGDEIKKETITKLCYGSAELRPMENTGEKS